MVAALTPRFECDSGPWIARLAPQRLCRWNIGPYSLGFPERAIAVVYDARFSMFADGDDGEEVGLLISAAMEEGVRSLEALEPHDGEATA